jgi:hypothetical protein
MMAIVIRIFLIVVQFKITKTVTNTIKWCGS